MSDKTKLSVILNIPDEHIKDISELQHDIKTEMKNVGRSENEFHVTIAVADGINRDDIPSILGELKPIITGLNIEITLGPLDSLANKDNVGVVYIAVESKELRQTYSKVRKVLEGHGGTFYYQEFKPHLTLCYLTDLLTDEQNDIVGNFAFSKKVNLTNRDIQISTKKGDEWVRVAFVMTLSKRG